MTSNKPILLESLFEKHATLRRHVDQIAPDCPDGLIRKIRLLIGHSMEYGLDRHVRLDTLIIANSMLMLKLPRNALDRVLSVLLEYEREDGLVASRRTSPPDRP